MLRMQSTTGRRFVICNAWTFKIILLAVHLLASPYDFFDARALMRLDHSKGWPVGEKLPFHSLTSSLRFFGTRLGIRTHVAKQFFLQNC
jgi:hypothetical protein